MSKVLCAFCAREATTVARELPSCGGHFWGEDGQPVVAFEDRINGRRYGVMELARTIRDLVLEDAEGATLLGLDLTPLYANANAAPWRSRTTDAVLVECRYCGAHVAGEEDGLYVRFTTCSGCQPSAC